METHPKQTITTVKRMVRVYVYHITTGNIDLEELHYHESN